MKKVFLVLTLLSRAANQFGNYAYRVHKITDTKGAELSPEDFDGIKEQEDGSFTMWSLEKVGKRFKQVKVEGVITETGGKTFINIENAESDKRLEQLDDAMRQDADLVRRIANISKVAQRTGVTESGQSILLQTVSSQLFAGIGQVAKRSNKVVFEEADEEQPELKAETPQQGAGNPKAEVKNEDIPEEEDETAAEGAGNAGAKQGKK